MKLEQKLSILKSLSEIAPENASAEDEENILERFLPLRSYSRLADPKVFLITGGRGSGKSELFHILTSENGLEHILSEADKKRYTTFRHSVFLTGFKTAGKESKAFPARTVFDKYAKMQDENLITGIWGGMLCAALLRHFHSDKEIEELSFQFLGRKTAKQICSYSTMPEQWLEWVSCNQEKWETFLDNCDNYFGSLNKRIYITYDELDRICLEYRDLFLYIRSLLSFWFTHNNRWENLKAKIFLRTDLYNSKSLHFVDSSKMRAYHLELQWDVLSLYRLLVKRLANSENPSAVTYLKSIPDLLADHRQKNIGYLPGDAEESFKGLMEKMVGRYMGKDPKRGFSYRWVPNHIQDANGDISPRPFLKCFVLAAAEQRAHGSEVDNPDDSRLLHPSRLQGALEEVSRDRVKELVEDEYGWLTVLSQKLNGQSMLMGRSEFLKYLAIDNWSSEEQQTLPGTTPDELLEALKNLGIFLETDDSRINVPEIYLHGFGLKRRGGIRRPRK